MSTDELLIIEKLNACKYAPGTWAKRFVRDLHKTSQETPNVELSDRQREWVYRVLYSKRKQLPATYQRFKDHPHCKLLK